MKISQCWYRGKESKFTHRTDIDRIPCAIDKWNTVCGLVIIDCEAYPPLSDEVCLSLLEFCPDCMRVDIMNRLSI